MMHKTLSLKRCCWWRGKFFPLFKIIISGFGLAQLRRWCQFIYHYLQVFGRKSKSKVNENPIIEFSSMEQIFYRVALKIVSLSYILPECIYLWPLLSIPLMKSIQVEAARSFMQFQNHVSILEKNVEGWSAAVSIFQFSNSPHWSD